MHMHMHMHTHMHMHMHVRGAVREVSVELREQGVWAAEQVSRATERASASPSEGSQIACCAPGLKARRSDLSSVV